MNGSRQATPVLIYQRPCGAVLIRMLDLRQLRIRMPRRTPTVSIGGEDYALLNAVAGVQFDVDPQAQQLRIEGEPRIFRPTRLDLRPEPEVPVAAANWGGSLNYGLFATHDDSSDATSYNGFVRGIAFSPWAYLDSQWVGAHADSNTDIFRLQTTLVRDLPTRIASLRAGDVLSRSGAWGSSQSIAGLQYQTNFATRPGLRFLPAATVDLLVDRAARASVLRSEAGTSLEQAQQRHRSASIGRVQHGPVEVVGLPAFRSGRYHILLDDIAGRRFTVSRNFLFSQGLRRTGSHDFSYSLGVKRRSILDDDYSGWVGGATHLYGLRHWLTVEGHAEADEHVRAIGGSGLFAVPRLGVLQLTGAWSESDLTPGVGHGGLAAVSLENRTRRYAYAGNVQCQEADFRRVEGGLGTRCRSFASVSASLPRRFGLSLSYANREPREGRRNEAVSVGLSGSVVPLRLRAFARGSYSLDDDDWSATLSISMPFSALVGPRFRGNRGGSGRSKVFDLQRSRLRVSANDSRNGDPSATARVSTVADFGASSLGLSLNAGLLNNDAFGVGAFYTGPLATASATVDRIGNSFRSSLGASSGLVWLGGALKPTRPQFSSFALVRLGEENAGVRVNGVRANKQGNALILPLQPFAKNTVRLDVSDLPLNASLQSSSFNVTPRALSGLVVDVDIARTRDFMLSIMVPGPEGQQALPIGSFVQASAATADAEEARAAERDLNVSPVASDGRVYISGAVGRLLLDVFYRGRQCQIRIDRLPERARNDRLPEIGPLSCTSR